MRIPKTLPGPTKPTKPTESAEMLTSLSCTRNREPQNIARANETSETNDTNGFGRNSQLLLLWQQHESAKTLAGPTKPTKPTKSAETVKVFCCINKMREVIDRQGRRSQRNQHNQQNLQDWSKIWIVTAFPRKSKLLDFQVVLDTLLSPSSFSCCEACSHVFFVTAIWEY